MNNTIDDKILSIISEVFNIEKNSISEETKQGDISEWDSMGHLNLFMEIENQMNVKFDIEEISKINSIKSLIYGVKSKL